MIGAPEDCPREWLQGLAQGLPPGSTLMDCPSKHCPLELAPRVALLRVLPGMETRGSSQGLTPGTGPRDGQMTSGRRKTRWQSFPFSRSKN